MKIGVGLPNVIPGTEGRRLVSWAQHAEEFREVRADPRRRVGRCRIGSNR